MNVRFVLNPRMPLAGAQGKESTYININLRIFSARKGCTSLGTEILSETSCLVSSAKAVPAKRTNNLSSAHRLVYRNNVTTERRLNRRFEDYTGMSI